MPSPSRKLDARDRADAAVNQQSLIYSLIQLRLFGLLLLLFLFFRLGLSLLLLVDSGPLHRLETIDDLAFWLLLFPLGYIFFLMGGGFRRKPKEFLVTVIVHRALLPLAVLCMIVLPVITSHDRISFDSTITIAQDQYQELLSSQDLMLDKANQASTPQQWDQFINAYQSKLPVQLDGSASLNQSRYKLQQILKAQREQFVNDHPEINLSARQQEIIGIRHTISTIATEVMAGVVMLLLFLQGRGELKRLGLNPAQFFSSNPDPRRKHHRRSRKGELSDHRLEQPISE